MQRSKGVDHKIPKNARGKKRALQNLEQKAKKNTATVKTDKNIEENGQFLVRWEFFGDSAQVPNFLELWSRPGQISEDKIYLVKIIGLLSVM